MRKLSFALAALLVGFSTSHLKAAPPLFPESIPADHPPFCRVNAPVVEQRLAALKAAVQFAAPISAATYTVINLNDSGAGGAYDGPEDPPDGGSAQDANSPARTIPKNALFTWPMASTSLRLRLVHRVERGPGRAAELFVETQPRTIVSEARSPLEPG